MGTQEDLVLLDKLDHLEIEGPQELQDLVDSRACLVHLGRMELLVKMGRRAFRESQA